MFARDYKIKVAADNKDCVFWEMIRKGEVVSPSDEDWTSFARRMCCWPTLVV